METVTLHSVKKIELQLITLIAYELQIISLIMAGPGRMPTWLILLLYDHV